MTQLPTSAAVNTPGSAELPTKLPTGIAYAVKQVHEAWRPYLEELLVLACTRRGAVFTDIKDVVVKGHWPEAGSKLHFTRVSDGVEFRAYRTPTTQRFKIRRLP